MIYYTTLSTPLREMTLASDGTSLVGAWFAGQKYFAGTLLDEGIRKDDLPLFRSTEEWLRRYFAGERPDISELPLAPSGTEFRRLVWGMLQEIPYGEVTTYGAIAKRIAAMRGVEKMSAQAVGQAVGHNPISVIIPCHRVVGEGGSLTGYAGGLELKKRLLEHEGKK